MTKGQDGVSESVKFQIHKWGHKWGQSLEMSIFILR
jgi:hypothetical protein